MSVVYVFENEYGEQTACTSIDSYNELTESGYKRIASLDASEYLMYQINHKLLKVEK